MGTLPFKPAQCHKVHPRPAVGSLLQSSPLSKRAPTEASPYLIILPRQPQTRRFFPGWYQCPHIYGKQTGVREEWELRLCSPWPEAKILLLIKLSRASLSAQAPREGARAAGLPPRVTTPTAPASPRSWRICWGFTGN